jgi:hypothetical protein
MMKSQVNNRYYCKGHHKFHAKLEVVEICDYCSSHSTLYSLKDHGFPTDGLVCRDCIQALSSQQELRRTDSWIVTLQDEGYE